MGDAFDTQLLIAIRRHRQSRALQLHKGGVIHPRLRQLFREIHADPRAHGIGFNHVINDPKAVFANCIIQRQCRVIARLQLLCQPQRLHFVAAPADLFQRVAH